MIQIDVRADLKRMTDRLTDVQKQQVPYATSVALNKTIRDLQQIEKSGMPEDIDRPTPFTVRGIQYKKSTKANLEAKVFIEQKRAEYLQWTVHGGTRKPRRKVLIIGLTERNQYGNTPGFRQFRTRLLAKKHHFEATMGTTHGIWKRIGKQRNDIQLVALYSRQADYTKTYRFGRRAFRSAGGLFRKYFTAAIETAIASPR